MYVAEALIKLDKINDAIQELSAEHLKAYQTFDQEIEALNAGMKWLFVYNAVTLSQALWTTTPRDFYHVISL